MSAQTKKSNLLVELNIEEQELLSGGQQPYVCYFCNPLYRGYGATPGYPYGGAGYGGGGYDGIGALGAPPLMGGGAPGYGGSRMR